MQQNNIPLGGRSCSHCISNGTSQDSIFYFYFFPHLVIFLQFRDLVGFFIPVSSLKVFGHSIHSERRRIYLGKSI